MIPAKVKNPKHSHQSTQPHSISGNKERTKSQNNMWDTRQSLTSRHTMLQNPFRTKQTRKLRTSDLWPLAGRPGNSNNCQVQNQPAAAIVPGNLPQAHLDDSWHESNPPSGQVGVFLLERARCRVGLKEARFCEMTTSVIQQKGPPKDQPPFSVFLRGRFPCITEVVNPL